MNEEITNRNYVGMTVNERLWESGQMDEFDAGIYDDEYKAVVKWKAKNMAVADYLLLSWNLTRLKK